MILIVLLHRIVLTNYLLPIAYCLRELKCSLELTQTAKAAVSRYGFGVSLGFGVLEGFGAVSVFLFGTETHLALSAQIIPQQQKNDERYFEKSQKTQKTADRPTRSAVSPGSSFPPGISHQSFQGP